MLFLVAAWIALLAVSVPTGAAILRWTGGTGAFDRAGDRLILSAWLGVLALANALLASSFLFPLSARLGAVLGLGLAVAALLWRPVREEIDSFRALLDARLVVAFLALVVGAAIFTAQPVVYVDTGHYHAGAIRWLSQYGAVNGIALIQDQLGFASSWFAVAAPCNPAPLRDHAMAVMGGFVLLMLSLHATICASRAFRREAIPSDWLVIAGSIVLIALTSVTLLVSPSPDLPVNVLVLIAGWSIFTVANVADRRASAASRLNPGPAAVPLLLALGAMTIKPQAGPLVIVAALFYIFFNGSFAIRRAAWAVVLVMAVLTPWLAYEFVTTGCPAYPLPACADVGWSVGSEAAREVAEGVEGPRGAEPGSGPGWWIGTWLAGDLTPTLAVLACCSILAIGGALVAAFRTGLDSVARGAAALLGIAGAVGLLLFLLNAQEIFIVTLVGLSLVARRPRAWYRMAARPRTRGHRGNRVRRAASVAIRRRLHGRPVRSTRRVSAPANVGSPARAALAPKRGFPRTVAERGSRNAAGRSRRAPGIGPACQSDRGGGGSSQLERFGWLMPPDRPNTVRIEATNGIPYRVPETTATFGTRPRSARSGLCWAAELPCTGHPVDTDEALRDVLLRDPSRGVAGGFSRSENVNR